MSKGPVMALAALATLVTTGARAACAPELASTRDREEIARAAAAAIGRADGEALEALLHPNATLYAATDGSLGGVSQVKARFAEVRAGLPSDLPPLRVTGLLAGGPTIVVRVARRWPGAGEDVEGVMAFNIEAGCIASVAIMA